MTNMQNSTPTPAGKEDRYWSVTFQRELTGPEWQAAFTALPCPEGFPDGAYQELRLRYPDCSLAASELPGLYSFKENDRGCSRLMRVEDLVALAERSALRRTIAAATERGESICVDCGAVRRPLEETSSGRRCRKCWKRHFRVPAATVAPQDTDHSPAGHYTHPEWVQYKLGATRPEACPLVGWANEAVPAEIRRRGLESPYGGDGHTHCPHCGAGYKPVHVYVGGVFSHEIWGHSRDLFTRMMEIHPSS